MKTAWSARVAMAALRLTLAGTLSMQALEMPNLSGDWQLDKNASDDPEKVMKEARPSAPSAGGGGPGGGGGMGTGRGHGHGAGRGAGHGSDGESRPDANFFATQQTLHVRHEEPVLRITDAAGRERVVYTDGRKTDEERSWGGTTKVTARWKEGHIEVSSVPGHGPKITEIWTITADRTQLTVTTRFEGGRMSDVKIRRVYDAVKPQEAPPTAQPDTPGGAEFTDIVSAGRR